jgi:hypothetical protein
MKLFFAACLLLAWGGILSAEPVEEARVFPPPLESYADGGRGVWDRLVYRAQTEPFNGVATAIFFLAILHTFAAPTFLRASHALKHRRQEILAKKKREAPETVRPEDDDPTFQEEVLHFLGEVEAVFGIWVVPLLLVLAAMQSWETAKNYLNHSVQYTEPMFVIVIMAIASSRPILNFAKGAMAVLGGDSVVRWWFVLLTVGPVLGSFITEPAAMTICALLLAKKFYDVGPSSTLRYATLGLLFVNISVGGTFTHFAAPPVLMVAEKWNWDMAFMATHFGFRALAGMIVCNGVYYLIFRKEFARLSGRALKGQSHSHGQERDPVPLWITAVHVVFLGWTVFVNHYPVLFIGGFLFFLAFTVATRPHQTEINIKGPLLVGFFLAGLVTHGGLQGWWIGPVLGGLGEVPLLLAATVLTAFNDNAAITYLATLVPDLSEPLKLAVVGGAVAGGGLTVIANAPNPAGQSILSKYFPDGVSPKNLALAALGPTAVMIFCFWIGR